MAYKDGLHKVPEYMHGGVLRYIEHGIRPGRFLTALFSNDLMDAFDRADDANTAAMRDWVSYIYNDAPIGCHGSPKHVTEWVESGGLIGINAENERRERDDNS